MAVASSDSTSIPEPLKAALAEIRERDPVCARSALRAFRKGDWHTVSRSIAHAGCAAAAEGGSSEQLGCNALRTQGLLRLLPILPSLSDKHQGDLIGGIHAGLNGVNWLPDEESRLLWRCALEQISTPSTYLVTRLFNFAMANADGCSVEDLARFGVHRDRNEVVFPYQVQAHHFDQLVDAASLANRMSQERHGRLGTPATVGGL